MRFPRRQSINERSLFQEVRESGVSRAGKYFVLGTLEKEELDELRVGLITTKKIGNAVTRNRVRRYFRALINKYGEALDGPRYLVFVGRWTAKEASFADIERDFLKVGRKLGIFREGAGI